MEHVHVPERTITYPAEDWWWCAGHFHKHQSEAAALKCEERPEVWGTGRRAAGSIRRRNEDGTLTVLNWQQREAERTAARAKNASHD